MLSGVYHSTNHCRWETTLEASFYDFNTSSLLFVLHAGRLMAFPLQWRHNERDGVSNHQPYHCLHNRLFRRRSKKTSKLLVTGLCVWWIHWWPVNSPHKWPVTRKMFPFDDVIMWIGIKTGDWAVIGDSSVYWIHGRRYELKSTSPKLHTGFCALLLFNAGRFIHILPGIILPALGVILLLSWNQ